MFNDDLLSIEEAIRFHCLLDNKIYQDFVPIMIFLQYFIEITQS